MGASHPQVPPMSPVPPGKKRVYVVGWPMSPHVGRAEKIARLIAAKDPAKYETWFYFSLSSTLRGDKGDGKGGVYATAKSTFNADDQERLKDHKSVPFVWVVSGGDDGAAAAVKGLGGRDRFCEWVAAQPDLMESAAIKALATTEPGFGDVMPDKSPGTAQQQP